ncbi:MAG: STAS domain-containing protein [Planctomycetota bacterium]|jgi:anti-anti-sigma factor
MKVKTQDYNKVTVVELQGELDSEFAELFAGTITDIIAAQQVGIVLDMSEISFIGARDYCNENNCQLRLAGLDENCAKILEVTRLENEFDRYTELAQAVKSFV